MKKKVLMAILLAVILPSLCWGAAGSCVQTMETYPDLKARKVIFTCTGGTVGDAGTIPNTATNSVVTGFIKGYYLYTVSAWPTSGGTAPDAADVFLLDANGEDLLGSVDGGTTANKGANLIHNTLKKTTMPYSHYLSQAYFPAVVNTLTLKVSNQATASANFTIELIFVR